MKIIELLNRIANDEDIPKKIKYRDKIWEYQSTIMGKCYQYYSSFCEDWRRLEDEIILEECLNDEVEIIEEKKEIEEFKTNYTCSELDFEIIDKINELVRISNKYARLLEKVENDE